jgi:hypothetical protein
VGVVAVITPSLSVGLTSLPNPLSPTGGNWSFNITGIPAAVPLNLIGEARQFFNGGDDVLSQASPGIFGETLMPTPIPGGTPGQVEASLGFVDAIGGPGPLPALGSSINPFTLLSGHDIDPTQFSDFAAAFQFAPQALIPPTGAPEPAAAAILGIGVLGLLAVRNRRRPGSSLPA